MRFKLVYRGPLPSNGRPSAKHDIRLNFHSQLAELWEQKPLKELQEWFLDRGRAECAITDIDGFEFVPLVNSKLDMIAKLSLLVLRRSEPGALINHGGDIDNRLKTLFDALTLPQPSQLPPNWKSTMPAAGPFFVLLQDDVLVTELAVQTDRLLDSSKTLNDVEIIIDVTTGVTRTSIGNLSLA